MTDKNQTAPGVFRVDAPEIEVWKARALRAERINDRLCEVIRAAFDEIDDSPEKARAILKHSGVIDDAH